MANCLYISNFFDFISKKIKGKRVLDCGAAGEEGIGVESSHWMHNIIKENASYALGFDLEKKAVVDLNERGYNFVYGDCENLDLKGIDEKFDIVFAGEIVEHLSKPGNFLDGIKKYLADDGQLIITTPNAFSLFRFVGNVVGANRENPQHVMVQNKETLVQLIGRYGYQVDGVYFFVNPAFYEHKRLRTVRKIGKAILHPLFKLRPQLGHQIMIIATKKNKKQEQED